MITKENLSEDQLRSLEKVAKNMCVIAEESVDNWPLNFDYLINALNGFAFDEKYSEEIRNLNTNKTIIS
jgi:NAD(P)H-hydrate repair Nnr-like enzyme with NAD(P)H-hydrate epimerase domain